MERGSWLALGAMAMSVFVVANDLTALSVALPQIEQDFDSDVSTVQWVVSAYALVFGVLIVTGGRLADMLGRRRIFFIGAAIFAGFSVLGGAAQSDIWLIVCRALMGVGGAMMWPAVLGMTYDILPADRAALAGGLIIGSAGFGNAAGPMLGGVLTDVLSWRWILFVNLPIAALACFFTWRSVHESKGAGAGEGIDVPGVVTLSVGLVALLLALDQVTKWGWSDPRILALFAGCVLLLIAFAFVERRAGARALVPREVMANREFRAACLTTLCMSAVFFVVLLYLPQFMQKILGYSPLEAGAGLLPLMGVFAIVSFAAGPLYERIGAKATVSMGVAAVTLGIFLISLIGRDSGWAALVPGMVVTGLGIGLFYSAITTAAVTAVDPSRTSLAGGIVYMFQVAGGSVGLGLTTTVFTTASEDRLQRDLKGLSEKEIEEVQGALAGTESAAEIVARQGAAAGDRLLEVVRDAFVTGLNWSFRLVALLALAGLVISVLFVGGSLLGRRSPT
ncbi:MAG TPA: MFS transporter [Thermoleophilaceae bacterium]|nr:MFS transporter [Thermoleophilaceae bacterium]